MVGGRVVPQVGNGMEVGHSSCYKNSAAKEKDWSLLTCEASEEEVRYCCCQLGPENPLHRDAQLGGLE